MSTDDVEQILEQAGLTVRLAPMGGPWPAFTIEDDAGRLAEDASYTEALAVLSDVVDVADADAILSAVVDAELVA